ncbi:MAG: hypothetical protein ACFFAY_12090 [Promethearchaeota archaeon]
MESVSTQLFPIAWIAQSQFVMEYLTSQIGTECISDPFLIADFASGENDKIPNYVHRVLPNILAPHEGSIGRPVFTYSTDLHGLRLDSLFHLFQEEGILHRARAVHARLETMDKEASFRQEQADYILNHGAERTELDKRLLSAKGIGEKAFHLGFLNNDVVGYMFEYYKAYTDALASLEVVRKTMRPRGVLLVTQPCSLYPVDNVEVLSSAGFSFIDGKDIDLKTGAVSSVGENTDLKTLSRRGHYTFFAFEA